MRKPIKKNADCFVKLLEKISGLNLLIGAIRGKIYIQSLTEMEAEKIWQEIKKSLIGKHEKPSDVVCVTDFQN